MPSLSRIREQHYSGKITSSLAFPKKKNPNQCLMTKGEWNEWHSFSLAFTVLRLSITLRVEHCRFPLKVITLQCIVCVTQVHLRSQWCKNDAFLLSRLFTISHGFYFQSLYVKETVLDPSTTPAAAGGFISSERDYTHLVRLREWVLLHSGSEWNIFVSEQHNRCSGRHIQQLL